MPDLALGRHHFQAQAQLAGISIAQDLRAPRVGRQIAANGAGALRRQAQREQKALIARGLLQGLQDATRFYRDRQIRGVKGPHTVHALQAQQHLGAALVGHATAHQTCVAPLRHDAQTQCRTHTNNGSHLIGVARSYHRQRAAPPAAAPVAFPG